MKLEKVTKRYKNGVVFENFSLELREGEICSVLGESGVGKTTLLNILSGATAFEGRVSGVGCVSYLFQKPCLLPNLTVKENLQFVLPKEEGGNISTMLVRVGLKGRENDYPKTLSGGQAQRVAIARAFLYPHDTLLMDEPFSSLDLKLKQELIALIAELWERKRSTVVFVTHDFHEAASLSHRAIVLKNGIAVCDVAFDGIVPRPFLACPNEERILVNALMNG